MTSDEHGNLLDKGLQPLVQSGMTNDEHGNLSDKGLQPLVRI